MLICVSAEIASPSPNASAGEEDIEDENTDRAERCDCPSSPDGKFAFVPSFSEQDSSGDRLQIIDLIEKKSGKKLQRIDEADMPVVWKVLWAPNSNAFALKTNLVWHPSQQGVEVYFRSGETFRKIELPNLDEGTPKRRSCGRRIQDALPSITGYLGGGVMKPSRFISRATTNG